jgi:hypothetical protein
MPTHDGDGGTVGGWWQERVATRTLDNYHPINQ